ncbi:hypothetical protein A8B78_19210 [Jannaschia sp. EhC01]|nr:hypothetical protein A8B78_19210 [Jannaschia sp. EhC01]
MRRWLIATAVVAGLGYLLEGQLSYLTLAGTAGAEGLLQRDGEVIPVTLFAGIAPLEGAAALTDSYRVLFGAGYVFTLPDGSQARCAFRLSRVVCGDGWQFAFTDERAA